MKRCVKTSHLGYLIKRTGKSANAFQIVRLVQRCQGNQTSKISQHGIVDQHTAAVLFATMHHPVRYGNWSCVATKLTEQLAQTEQRLGESRTGSKIQST